MAKKKRGMNEWARESELEIKLDTWMDHKHKKKKYVGEMDILRGS